MIRQFRRSIPVFATLRTTPRRIARNGSTIKHTSYEHGDHNPSKMVYYVILGATVAGCGGLHLMKALTKDKTYVDISNNINKSRFEDKANYVHSVQAWPNIEHALTFLYGAELNSYLIITLNFLKFAKKSIGGSDSAKLSEGVTALEESLKNTLAGLIPYCLEKAAFSSEEAQMAIGSLYNAAQSAGSVAWEALEEEFSGVDWSKERAAVVKFDPKTKEMFLKKVKHLSYDANVLERSVERYLVGKKSS